MLKKIFFPYFQQRALRHRRSAGVIVLQHDFAKTEQLPREQHDVQIRGFAARRLFDLDQHLPFQYDEHLFRWAPCIMDLHPFPVIALAAIARQATKLLLGTATEKRNRFQEPPVSHVRITPSSRTSSPTRHTKSGSTSVAHADTCTVGRSGAIVPTTPEAPRPSVDRGL